VRHYVAVSWFGRTGKREESRLGREVLSRRHLLRRSGDVGVGALVGAAVLAFGPDEDGVAPRPVPQVGTGGLADGRRRTQIDVRDHGAVGDGTTDDTAALQAALDAVPAGGGTVFLPAGRYAVSATLWVRRHNTTVVGEGPGQRAGTSHDAVGSRLEAVGSLDDGPMVRVQSDDNRAPLHGVTLRDIALDGMGVATGSGIHYRSYRGLIEHVFLYNFAGQGLDFQGYPHWDLYDTVVAFSQVSRCGGAGLLLGEGATDMHFTSCVVFDNQDNMQLAGGGSVQVTGCHFYTASRHNVFFNGAGSRSKFANCKIEGSGGDGVVIDSARSAYSDILFTGCNFSSNGRIAPNTFDHFAISGPRDNPVNRTVISGCSFSTKAGSPVARYFVRIGPNGHQTTIVGNNFGPAHHYGTDVLLDDGAASNPSVIRSNGGHTSSDAALIRDTIGTALIAGSNIMLTPSRSQHTITVSSCATVRTVTDDTVLAADDGVVRVNTEFGATVTVPTDATTPIPVGSVIRVRRHGTGEVALAAADGVTLTGPTDGVDRYASYVLTKVFPDDWDVEA
jgi:hypothetical protein